MNMKGWTRTQLWIGVLGALVLLLTFGCEKNTGPDKNGEIILSSQLFGTESYYLFGYNFEESDMFKYNYLSPGEIIPDIINEGFPVIGGEEELSLPGFNTPAGGEGFALLGEFSSMSEAESFYRDYKQVEEGLRFEVLSDTVRLYQVWIQQTAAGNYAKMLIREINLGEGGSGSPYSEVTLEFNYSNDGSGKF